MSEKELQDWLYSTALADELRSLAQRTARLEIDNLHEPRVVESPSFDWGRLLLASSILVKSPLRAHREAALRIATSALLLDTKDHIRDAAALVLEKLSNRRAVMLAEKRGRVRAELSSRIGVAARMESEERRLNNSVLLGSTGERVEVNDFQRQFWAGASQPNAWLSASAPTASGKTFLVLKWLLDTLVSGESRTAVYLAPTRALVSEIEAALQSLVSDDDLNVDVTSLPSAEKYRASRSGSKKCIFVFTQERVHLLANLLRDDLQIDLVVVDEAHKIGDHQRGVILQDALERLQRSNPELRAVFVSPATQNPEMLLDDAPEGIRRISVDSDFPTVLQNIIVAHQVPRKPKEWALNLREGTTFVPLGTLALRSKPMGLRKRLAFIAAAAGERGGTLVYANGAAEAEELALLISQLLPKLDNVDQELTDLADLARKGIHKSYILAPLVERGVAFHYGNMPSLIRLEIERLFRSGKIRFLVCTSTLIEGVNLSCRTIVVRGPRKGAGHPMEAHDFWNLAGRAGRWGDEFQGNIICVDASNTEAWPTGVPDRARYPIRRETDSVVAQTAGLVEYLNRRAAGEQLTPDSLSQFEQVGAYLVAAYLRTGSLSSTPLAKRHSAESIEALEAAVASASTQIDLPSEMAGRNPGVSLLGLQNLLLHFRSYEGSPEDLVPAPPESEDAYERFSLIMNRVNEFILPTFTPAGLVPLHALIVLEWLKGFSLPTIIRKRMEYQQRRGQSFDAATLIRNTLELIEDTARFRAPKFFSAYVDVLNFYLQEIGETDLIDDDLDIGTALEFGVSSITLRALMELGMSRMGAVALYEKIALDNLDQAACLNWVLERRDEIDSIGLPAIIAREVREKILAKAAEGDFGETS
ncbi:DEAD/DEAH box helicase [Devosia sp. 1566]|uniref:DEAD/DEAH box helicase n=1 Tax=Devosia sp. 1566 TaxID=2499144 RepID=UPI000FDA509A|nr:DEAD/DEAH box helicase [Devosia sp. 1566]